MSVRPRPGAEVPELTARIARASNPEGTTAMWVRDRLEGLWSDEDFAHWYSRDGRPGLSPAQLATVSMLQFLLNLSDRQATEAVRRRIEFTCALGLELDDPGFRHSVLTDFRDRLAQAGRADELMGLALERMKQAGLVTERGSARTDSTYVLAAVRDPTRLELITEAVRAALEELAHQDPEMLDWLIDQDRATRYGRPVPLGGQPSRPATRLQQTGQDAHLPLTTPAPHQRPRAPMPDALRQIYLQNSPITNEKVRPRTEKDGLPPAGTRIISPYDLHTGDTRRARYPIHITETCDPDTVDPVTDLATTASSVKDSQALTGIHTRPATRGPLPAEHPADGGYITLGHPHAAAHDLQITMIGPLGNNSPRQARTDTGLAPADSTIDFDKRHATCPAGKTTGTWIETTPAGRAPITGAKSDKRLYDPCPHRASRTRPPEGRTVNFPPRHPHELQERNRAQQADPNRLRTYATRSGVESTVAEFASGTRHADAATAATRRLTPSTSRPPSRSTPSISTPPNHQAGASENPLRSRNTPQKYITGRELSIPRWWSKGGSPRTKIPNRVSFNAVINKELIYPTSYQTRKHAERDIAAYIELFHNCQRVHSGIGCATPLEAYREKQANLTLAA